ncbi:MAG: zinc-binding alcohol dehydrogenase family protein [Nakamurella sp.]
MYAAVVTSFGSAPRYQEFHTPEPRGETAMLVDVLAAGLHPRVRSQAAGSHYTSTNELPLVPGIDGVGRGSDGQLRYFLLPDTSMGSMAEQTVVDTRRSIALPETSDPVAIAAAMNPAMSSWIALRRRIEFHPGQNVLVLGATGSAGRLAVAIAKLLGANKIIGAGRNADRLDELAALGATGTVRYVGSSDGAGRLAEMAKDVDVVIDYLWGEPTAAAMLAVVSSRADRRRPLSWIEVGSVAGPTAMIPSAALRAARLQILGSGQGSVGTGEILAELPALAAAISDGTLDIATRAVPLADVEQAWAEAAGSTRRIVLTPGQLATAP